MANEIYNKSWWGIGVCSNTINWGIVYKPYAGCGGGSPIDALIQDLKVRSTTFVNETCTRAILTNLENIT